MQAHKPPSSHARFTALEALSAPASPCHPTRMCAQQADVNGALTGVRASEASSRIRGQKEIS